MKFCKSDFTVGQKVKATGGRLGRRDVVCTIHEVRNTQLRVSYSYEDVSGACLIRFDDRGAHVTDLNA